MSKIHYSIEGNVVTAEVYQGERFSEKTETVSVSEFDLGDCPEELADGESVKTFAAYGLLKWLQDRTSGVKGAAEKVEAMTSVFEEKAKAGLWKAPAQARTSGPRTSRRKVSAILAQAIADLTGTSAVEAEANLRTIDKEQFASITSNEKVLAKVEELEAATSGASADALADLLD